jgi:hypothetical protein
MDIDELKREGVDVEYSVETELFARLVTLPVGMIPPGKIVITEPSDTVVTVKELVTASDVALIGRAVDAKRVSENVRSGAVAIFDSETPTLALSIEVSTEEKDELVVGEVALSAVYVLLVVTVVEKATVLDTTIADESPVPAPEESSEATTVGVELPDEFEVPEDEIGTPSVVVK